MITSLTIDTRGMEAMVRGFDAALSSLGQMPNTDRVLRTLIRRIVEGCIRRTKIATAKFIRARFKAKGNSARAPGIAMSINSGIRGGMEGRVWYGEDPEVSTNVTPKQREALKRRGAKHGGKVWTIMENAIHPGAGMLRRFQALDAMRQSDIKGRLRGLMEAALRARGLARNSWFQIAQKLGIAVSIPGAAQVASARPSSGASYDPAAGTARYEGPRQLYYDLVNSYPFRRFKIPAARIFSSAIQGEMGYFRNNLKHGVFADLQAIAKKYKGIFN